MYQTVTVQIDKNHPAAAYCYGITRLANNLYNAGLFVTRQVLTAVNKEEKDWFPLEREVMTSIRNALPAMGEKYTMPVKGHSFLSAGFLEAYFRATRNPDFFRRGLPRQTAQKTLKKVEEVMTSFYGLVAVSQTTPQKLSGKPGLPKYRPSGGNWTAVLTNQDCDIRLINDKVWLKMPLVKNVLKTTEEMIKELPEGKSAPELPKKTPPLLMIQVGGAAGNTSGVRLKQVTIKPFHDVYLLQCNLETSDDAPAIIDLSEEELRLHPPRACCIDLGVNNLAAITNNCGLPCILYKGGVVKSTNQQYNKEMARIKSEQTKGTTNRFVPTPESDRLCVWRNNRIKDCFYKAGKFIMAWAKANGIELVVIGHNTNWKAALAMGPVNNQKFAYIPFGVLIGIIKHWGERLGIAVVEQEESYTSQASFPDGDPIPVYGEKGAGDVKFSGYRGPSRYNGHTKTPGKKTKAFQGEGKPSGFHGLYKTGTGTIINADLNGSANTGRKFLDTLFANAEMPNFSNTVIIHHPDELFTTVEINREAQPTRLAPSKSKLRRSHRRFQQRLAAERK